MNRAYFSRGLLSCLTTPDRIIYFTRKGFRKHKGDFSVEGIFPAHISLEVFTTFMWNIIAYTVREKIIDKYTIYQKRRSNERSTSSLFATSIPYDFRWKNRDLQIIRTSLMDDFNGQTWRRRCSFAGLVQQLISSRRFKCKHFNGEYG